MKKVNTVQRVEGVKVYRWEGVNVGDFIPGHNNYLGKGVTVVEVTSRRGRQGAIATVIVAE